MRECKRPQLLIEGSEGAVEYDRAGGGTLRKLGVIRDEPRQEPSEFLVQPQRDETGEDHHMTCTGETIFNINHRHVRLTKVLLSILNDVAPPLAEDVIRDWHSA